jgi:RNA polymerase sigma-70 factor (ECF subfamily)
MPLPANQAVGNVSLGKTVEVDFAVSEATGDPAVLVTRPEVDLWELIRKVQAGDPNREKLIDEIYRNTWLPVYRCAFGVLHNLQDAENIASDVFVRFLLNVNSLKDIGVPLATWLKTVSRNASIDYKRSAAYKRANESRPTDVLQAIVDEGNPYIYRTYNVEEIVINHALYGALRVALAGLQSAKQAECIRLRFVEDLSVAQTAEVMKINEGAVKTLTVRGMANLRKAMAEWGDE